MCGTSVAISSPRTGRCRGDNAAFDPRDRAPKQTRDEEEATMARTTKRGRKTRTRTGIDKRQLELETIRNRRYIAFVRAVIGAARSRNSSR
jgi:hypothetical protein